MSIINYITITHNLYVVFFNGIRCLWICWKIHEPFQGESELAGIFYILHSLTNDK